jgi:cytidylate kinase
MNKGFSIAIDGPVAAGKGTIAPALAKKLNGFYINTGAMYRCVALFCLKNNIDLDNEELIDSTLQKIKIDLKNDRVFLNNEDVTEEIKKENISMASSKVALYTKVRKKLVLDQQQIANKVLSQGTSVVAEGRDTATKVLPNANLKVFLTADPKIRAKRRLVQIQQRKQNQDFENVLRDIIKRDQQDSQRKIDPLVTNPKDHGYFVLDNSNLSEKETIDAIIEKVNNND